MKKNYWLLAFSIILVFSCSKNKTKDKTTDLFAPGKPLAELKNKKLEEASGLVTSIQNSGYLWTHNDSGNDAEVFLLDLQAKIKLTCTLKGVDNRDWEDIAVGPGPEPGKTYLYIADIGDNVSRHKFKFIYRFEEPVFQEGVDKIEITNIDKITFQLSDKIKDTEAILLDPKTKDLFIISKREEPVHVYQLKFPYPTDDKTLKAIDIASVPLTQIVAGDFSADGSELLLKDYEEVYYWKIDALPLTEALKNKPEILDYEQEAQGESVAWARDGSGYYTLTEKIKGEKCELLFYKRN